MKAIYRDKTVMEELDSMIFIGTGAKVIDCIEISKRELSLLTKEFEDRNLEPKTYEQKDIKAPENGTFFYRGIPLKIKNE
jgi:hypothetical protein